VSAAEHSTSARLSSSPRSRLARVALQAATAMPQVVVGVRGPRGAWVSVDAGEILEGVVVTARRDGRFDIELHVVVRWPSGSLLTLADQVRATVKRAAGRAQLDGVLGQVTVAFEDVREASSEEVAG